MSFDQKPFLAALKKICSGAVRTDPSSLAAYSEDASFLHVPPLAVFQPVSVHQLQRAVKLCSEYGVSFTPRGSATGTTGGCLGKGVVIDCSCSLNKILRITENSVTVQPGAILSEVNKALLKEKRRIGPETSTEDIATVGGMLANNAAGGESLRFGTMADAILEAQIVLSNGSVKHLHAYFEHTPLVCTPFEKELQKIADKYLPEWEKRFKNLPRMSSGYRLDLYKNNCYLPARILAGSEGTLGIITELTLRTEPLVSAACSLFAAFPSLKDACDFAASALKENPLSCELVDQQILLLGKNHPMTKESLSFLSSPPPAALLIKFSGESEGEAKEKARMFAKTACSSLFHISLSNEEAKKLYLVRKLGLTLLLSQRTYRRAVGFLEDMAVPVEKLGHFFSSFLKEMDKRGIPYSLYGHAGPGCLHLRPYLDLRKKGQIEEVETLMLQASDLLKEVGGSLSGEHGDGLVRSWLAPQFFAPSLYKGFLEIKNIFDPQNICNPEKVVNGPPLSTYLKPPIKEPGTFLDFSQEGGFALSVDLCNGNGLCRSQKGAMCPSFQATLDEYDSTRARAKVLRDAISDKGVLASLQDQEAKKVLDLCISCKACKKECPSGVDMAKMKAETLYQNSLKRGFSWRSLLIGNFRTLLALGSFFPSFSNALTPLFSRLIGFSKRRSLPRVAKHSFKEKKEDSPNIYLFIDTYARYLENSSAKSSLQLLEALGWKVSCIAAPCCGRQEFSKGLLKQARKKGRHLLEYLAPILQTDVPLLFLEPSCASMATDDLLSLFAPGSKEKTLANLLKQKTCSLEHFLAKNLKPYHRSLFQKLETPFLVHVHCHERSLSGSEAIETVFQKLGLPYKLISKGCCGMAGSFGYEKEHDAISRKIAEVNIDKNLLKKPGILIASGISCRTQFQDVFGIKSVHLSDALLALLDKVPTQKKLK